MVHYSFFIRPGMHRLIINRNDNLTAVEMARRVMVTAFSEDKGKIIVVAINYEQQATGMQLDIKQASKEATYKRNVTTASSQENMKFVESSKITQPIPLPARSITTLVIDK